MPGPLPVGIPWPPENKLEDLQLNGSNLSGSQSFHAYVHIPFCKVRCGYCDFNTYLATDLAGMSQSDFHLALIQEIEFSKRVFEGSELTPPALSSVFFGGGTPSLFSTQQLSAILSSLQSAFGLVPSAEITIEANPDTVDEHYLTQLLETGVNRISFGVQSFDVNVLRTLDRTHDPKNVPSVVEIAKRLGFEVSIDLIYGTPGETLDSWAQTLDQAIALGTDHISAYSLIVEAGTPLARLIKKGELEDINPDFQADCYQLAADTLEAAGFDWYEVSNWSRGANKNSLHNQAYWQSRNWWGYGPGAHSHFSGNRWWNLKHPVAYSAKLVAGVSPAAGMERLDLRQALEEQVLLQLRTVQGIELSKLRELQVSQQLVAEELAAGNLRLLPDQRIGVTNQARLTADGIVLRMLTTK